MKKKRVLSGIQPSGKLHLGNLVGALSNWVNLQDKYDCFYFIADIHALTTGYAETGKLKENILDVAMDMLSAGLDPEKSTLFIQSDIPEHSELHLMFSMITPLSWLERIPTYKAQIEELKGKDLGTYGFLGYPVLQAADILIYKADMVPVGQDQLPHLELTREIARRFNHFYKEVFPLPKELLAASAVLPGLDGRKMSKSYGNTIGISDSPEAVFEKISAATTDPARVKREDKGHPEVCAIFAYHKIFNDTQAGQISIDCSNAKIGCVECKKMIAKKLNEYLAPIYEKRKILEKRKDQVREMFIEGGRRAQITARQTLSEAKKAMGIL
ncbi:MAG: tryptophan--tRNA ligase [bacterium]